MSEMNIQLDPDAITLLVEQLDNYPHIAGYLENNIAVPSVLLVPSVITSLDSELARNPGLLYETYTFLDQMSLVSMIYSGDPGTLFRQVSNSLLLSRHTEHTGMLLCPDEQANILYKDKGDLAELLDANKILVALHLYSLLVTMTGKSE